MKKEMPVNPYKALEAYEEWDQKIFHGRETEQYRLQQLVKQNFLTVVFGKAGMGKTSLLKAGLFPILRKEGFVPVNIRLTYSAGTLPVEQIRQELNHQIIRCNLHEEMPGTQKEPLEQNETLWEYFQRVRLCVTTGDLSEPVIPVLVFDQFEELFTHGKDHPSYDSLVDELYYLLENQLPDSLKEVLARNKSKLPYPGRILPLRVILSLREDYLAPLNDLKKSIPSIDQVLFRVLPFDGEQARQVIDMPGGLEESGIADTILELFQTHHSHLPDSLTDDKKGKKIEVDPSLLSILCYQLFKKKHDCSIDNAEKQQYIKWISSAGDKGSSQLRDTILKEYYESVMKSYPPEVELRIETKLLTESGSRELSLIESDDPLRESFDYLEKVRILRKMPIGKDDYFEIIHDVLTPIIIKNRAKRQQEKRELEIKEKIQQLSRRKVQRMTTIALVLCLALLALAVSAGINAIIQYKKTIVRKLVSDARSVMPENNVKALRIIEVAYKKSLPSPPPQVLKTIYDTAYSFTKRPYYSADLKHAKNITYAAFLPSQTRILTIGEDHAAVLWDLAGKLLTHFPMHDDAITSVRFSADGSKILTASRDKTAKLWDLKGKLLTILPHESPVVAAIFSRNGTKILTASGGWAALWDLNVDPPLPTYYKEDASHAIVGVAFSPECNLILTVSKGNTAKLWDTGGKLLATLNHNGDINTAEFSPDGNQILTASSDQTAKLWDKNGQLRRTYETHNEAPVMAGFSHSGEYILTLAGNQVKIWNMKGTSCVDLVEHNDLVFNAQFSPDDKYVLTLSLDNTARLWNISGNLLADLNRSHNLLYAAKFSPDGKKIITASGDAAKVWNLRGGLMLDLDKHRADVIFASYSSDGKHILTGASDKTVKLWQLGNDLFIDLNTHHKKVTTGVFSPDGDRVLTGYEDGAAIIWNSSGSLLYQLKEHKRKINQAFFSPGGSKVLTCSDDGNAILWSNDGKLERILDGHTDKINTAVFSPDGKLILTASRDSTAIIYSASGDIIKRLEGHNKPVTSAVFSPDIMKIVTASSDKTVILWSVKGEMLDILEQHKKQVNTAVFSPDCMQVITASEDGTAILWCPCKKKIILCPHDGPVNGALFSPDGERILTWSDDKTAKLWTLSGKCLVNFTLHTNIIKNADFSADSRQIITASADRTAKVWNLKGELLANLTGHSGMVNSAAFSKDGRMIITTSNDTGAKLWHTPPAIMDWLETAPLPGLSEKEKTQLGLSDN